MRNKEKFKEVILEYLVEQLKIGVKEYEKKSSKKE